MTIVNAKRKKLKHKWDLLEPHSGPLVAVGSLENVSRYKTDWQLHCLECNETVQIPYDVLDTDRIVAFIEEQGKRNDCKGKQ